MSRKALFTILVAGLVVSMSFCLAQSQSDNARPRGGARGPRGGFRPGGAPVSPQALLESFDRTTSAMPTALTLTPAQSDRFKSLVSDHRRTLERLVKQMEAENEKFDASLNQILTPEQQTKLKDLQKGPAMGPGGAGRGGFLNAVNEMNLTPEKKTQVEKIMSDFRDKMRSAPRGDREARDTLRKEMEDQLRQVLSADEFQQLMAKMPQRGGRPGPQQ